MSCSKIQFSKKDPKLMQLIQRRNLSYDRIRAYDRVFSEIYHYFGVEPQQLYDIAKKEQKQVITNESGVLEFLEIEDRTVTKYQYLYNQKLTEINNNSNRTRQLKIDIYRAIFNEFDIQLPKNIKFDIPKERVRTKDLPTWKNVNDALSISSGIKQKAILAVLATSGVRVSDLVRFTIQDLLDSCSIYFKDGKGTLNELLEMNPDHIIPCFDFHPLKTQKKGNLCITFITPEATSYLFQYLKERIKQNERREKKDRSGYKNAIKKGKIYKKSLEQIEREAIIKPEDPLFKSYRGDFFNENSIEKIFERINDKLELGKDKNGLYGKFRPHNLRKLFGTTCRQNMLNISIQTDKSSELDLVSLFLGHTPPNSSNSEVYEAVVDDNHDSYIRKTYQALIPYLSIQPTELKDVKTKHFIEMEEKYLEMEEKYKSVTQENNELKGKVSDLEEQIETQKTDILKELNEEVKKQVQKSQEDILEDIKKQAINDFTIQNINSAPQLNKLNDFINKVSTKDTIELNKILYHRAFNRILKEYADEDRLIDAFYPDDQYYIEDLSERVLSYIEYNSEEVIKEEKQLYEQQQKERKDSINIINEKNNKFNEAYSIAIDLLNKYNKNFAEEEKIIFEEIIQNLNLDEMVNEEYVKNHFPDIKIVTEDMIESVKTSIMSEYKEKINIFNYNQLKEYEDIKPYLTKIMILQIRQSKLEEALTIYTSENKEINKEDIDKIVKQIITQSVMKDIKELESLESTHHTI